MNLKGLIHRELSEGLTEAELASSVGVSVQTIANIVADQLPTASSIWEKFAKYFRMDAHFLRSGGPLHSEGLFERTADARQSSIVQMRKVPMLKWHQIDQMVASNEPPRVVHAEGMLETDVPGIRTFALQVKDDSMQPLFHEGEIMFVNPDLPSGHGHYVVVESEDGGGPERALLREFQEIGGQAVLHPLNRQYENRPLMRDRRILGRVVRLRKNL